MTKPPSAVLIVKSRLIIPTIAPSRRTTKLFVLVRPKIAFLSEQSAQHFRQLVQVGLGRWFDYDMFAHRFYCLSQSRTRWQSPNQRSTVAARGAIDNGFLTPSVTALKSGRSYFPVL